MLSLALLEDNEKYPAQWIIRAWSRSNVDRPYP